MTSKYFFVFIFLLSLTCPQAMASDSSMLWRSCAEVQGKGEAYCKDAELAKPLSYYLHPAPWTKDDEISNQLDGVIRSRSKLKPQIKEIFNTPGWVHIVQVNYFLPDRDDLVKEKMISDATKTLSNKDANEQDKWNANNNLEYTKIYSDENTDVLDFHGSVVLAEKEPGQFVPLMRWIPYMGKQKDPRILNWGNKLVLVFLADGQNTDGMVSNLGWVLNENSAVFLDADNIKKIVSLVGQNDDSLLKQLMQQ